MQPPEPHAALEIDLDPHLAALYRPVLQALAGAHIEVLVGGAFALSRLAGVQRATKDLDLFIREADWPRVEALLRDTGYETELAFPHWLGKAYRGEVYIDFIFNSGNGLSPVDKAWFEHAIEAEFLGLPVKLTPAEEMIWSKAFVMERERYDGADVAHLLRARARAIDWQRLRLRFGSHWRVLLSHLVQFGYIYPGHRSLVPAWLSEELIERLLQEVRAPAPPSKLCAGTLLSREQYLADIEQGGYQDGRHTSMSTMQPGDVALWTDAIE